MAFSCTPLAQFPIPQLGCPFQIDTLSTYARLSFYGDIFLTGQRFPHLEPASLLSGSHHLYCRLDVQVSLHTGLRTELFLKKREKEEEAKGKLKRFLSYS
jgi:hypothetical protein